jgi:D-alanine-D-alanine ligase
MIYASPNEISLLLKMEQRVRDCSANLGICILLDDPQSSNAMPALGATKFLERLDSDTEINRVIKIFNRLGITPRVVRGFDSLLQKCSTNEMFDETKAIKVLWDKTEGGGHELGFGPGRRSFGSLISRQYHFIYSHVNPYTAAISRHKFHQALILEKLGILVPKTWSYDYRFGWIGPKPDKNLKLIAKSTFEAWSVGVSEELVGNYTELFESRVVELSRFLGQPVCVQEYIEGPEIGCLVFCGETSFAIGALETYAKQGAKSNGNYLIFDDHATQGAIGFKEPTIENATQAKIVENSLSACKILGIDGFGRLDYRIAPNGDPYLFDIADNPGTSPTSAFTNILKDAEIDIDQIPLMLLGAKLVAG